MNMKLVKALAKSLAVILIAIVVTVSVTLLPEWVAYVYAVLLVSSCICYLTYLFYGK